MQIQITEGQLRAFVERIEALNASIADLTEDRKEVYTELKGQGFDGKIVRKLIAIRKRRADDLAEEQAILDLYLAAVS